MLSRGTHLFDGRIDVVAIHKQVSICTAGPTNSKYEIHNYSKKSFLRKGNITPIKNGQGPL